MLVVLMRGSAAEPSLQPAAVAELARLGVTSVDLVRDGRTLGVVVEGWAFDPGDSADAVLAVIGCGRSAAQALQPVLHVAVSAAIAGDSRSVLR